MMPLPKTLKMVGGRRRDFFNSGWDQTDDVECVRALLQRTPLPVYSFPGLAISGVTAPSSETQTLH